MLHLLKSLAGRLRNFLWWQDIHNAWKVRNECYCAKDFFCPVTHDETPKEEYRRMLGVYGFCVLCGDEYACGCTPAEYERLVAAGASLLTVPASFVDEDGIEWELLK